jgi:hypothetical protein
MFGVGAAIKAIVTLIIVLIVAAGGYFLINLKADLAIAQENSRKLEEGVKLQQEAPYVVIWWRVLPGTW